MLKSHSKPAPQAPVQIVGHLDYVDEGYAYGWAFNPLNPHNRVSVDILCEGKLVGHGPADGYREDLKEAKIGDGNHLFKIKLSYELYDGKVHSLYARNASNNILLTGSNVIMGPEKATLPFPLISRDEGENYISELCQSLTTKTTSKQLEKITHAFQIASLLQETGKLDDSRYAWNSLIKVLGPNSFCCCKVAESYLLEGQHARALEHYKHAAEQNLLNSWAHLGMSICHKFLDDYEAAESALDFASSTLPISESISDQILVAKLALLPRKIEILLANEKKSDAIGLLFQYLLADPEQNYVLDTIKGLLGQEIQHSGSKNTAAALTSHHQSLRLLEMAIAATTAISTQEISSNDTLQAE
ncbi:tetratricopeptide repeat protein [Pseudomonas sp. NMI542_15]|uniref:tetratricopeptide repeat protein n=1 Tax=Pseudomonas sp. NMI542_15 TaxID=2903148 RepID=UPI001E557A7E|nr:tetratricopeptide repeat protein [Pseudomonas sp. NMI542_15]MCE0780828.1 tetratricopeptide repeat protein [Pseudomonas sp. NMI542_15]